MKGAWLALAMMAASISFAHAQERSHAPHKSPSVEQKSNDGAADNRYPLISAPLPVIIIKNAKQQYAAAAEEASANKYHNTYLGTQISIAKSAKTQAGITYAAIFVGGADTILTWIALCFLILTYRQTKRVATETEKSVALAREEFRATHRPKITVRACKLNMGSIDHRHKVTCTFVYQNEGESDAYILEVGTRVFHGPDPWTNGQRIIEFEVPPAITIVVKSGEDRNYETLNNSFDTEQWGTPEWWFAGYIKYSDRAEGGTIRKIGFLRRWQPGTKNWLKYPSEEYEYSY